MSRSALFLACSSVALTSLFLGCESGGTIQDDTSSTGTGGKTTTSSSSKASSSASSTSAATGSSTSAGTGTGGMAGWPTCDTQPPGSATKTIPDVWVDDPAQPTAVWMQGVYVTAVARNGCAAGQSCEIFIQQDETYADLTAAQQKSIRIGIAPSVAEHFVGIGVGDRVDVYGFAFRNTQNGLNELGLLVTDALQGCAKVVGTGNPVPLPATLADLTTPNYEANGPVLVTLTAVSGKPHMPGETFAMWDTATGPMGTLTEVTSLSPFCLANQAFTGLTPEVITDFTSVTGVFGIFAPPATPLIKYEELYIRDMTEAPHP